MAERPVEARLADLAGALTWPPAPDLRGGVRAGIARGRRRRLLLLAAAAIAALALAGGAAAAAELHVRGAAVQQVPSLPPGPAGAQLDLGTRYRTLAGAEQAAGFHALVPAALGPPDEAWYRPDPGVITLLYHPRRGLPASGQPGVGALVMEATASVSRTSFAKLAPGGSSVTSVTVNGGPGFWISGAPHAFFFYGDRGAGRTDSFRLAGDVLIWNQAGLVIRIESGLDEAGALHVAGTAGGGAVYQRHEVVALLCRDPGAGGGGLRRSAGRRDGAAARAAPGCRPGVRARRRRVLGARQPDGEGRQGASGGHAVA